MKHGRILGVSPNVYRNNPRNVSEEHLDRCSIHAEVRSLRKAGFPKKAILFVVRVNGQNEVRKAMPCDGCMSLINELQCKVVHT